MATSDTQFISSTKNWKQEWHNSAMAENSEPKRFINAHVVGVRSFECNSNGERTGQGLQNDKPWRLPHMAQTNSPGKRALYTREKIRRFRKYLKEGTMYANGSIHNAIHASALKRSAPVSPPTDFSEQITDNQEIDPLVSCPFECSDNTVKRQKIKSGISPDLNFEDQMSNFNIADTIEDILSWGRGTAEFLASSVTIVSPLKDIDLPQLSFDDVELSKSEDSEINPLVSYSFEWSGNLVQDQIITSATDSNPDQISSCDSADAIDDILAWGTDVSESPVSPISSLSETDQPQLSIKDIQFSKIKDSGICPYFTYSFECSDNFVQKQKIRSGTFSSLDSGNEIFRSFTEVSESPNYITSSLSETDLPQLSFKDIKLFKTDDGKTNVLGAGVYGFVSRGKLLVEEGSHDIVAKFNRSSKNRFEEILDEARVLQHLSPTGVVPTCYGVIEDKNISKLPVIVQECFADGEDFYKALDKGALTKKDWIEACINAAYGLDKIHKKGVLHNDLKPDNILVNKEGDIRFIDMGMATFAEGMFYPVGRSLAKCRHLAPEVKRGEETTTFSDIYSFGIVMEEVAKNAAIPELMNLSKLVLSFIPSDRITLHDLVVRLKDLLNQI